MRSRNRHELVKLISEWDNIDDQLVLVTWDNVESLAEFLDEHGVTAPETKNEEDDDFSFDDNGGMW